MKKVAIVACGAYMDNGYGCPGEWRCLKAAAMGEGSFDEKASVLAFVKCICPGRRRYSGSHAKCEIRAKTRLSGTDDRMVRHGRAADDSDRRLQKMYQKQKS